MRASAVSMQGMDQTIRLLEAQMYASDSAAWDACNRPVAESVEQLKVPFTEELESRRQKVLNWHKALSYLQRFDIIPADIISPQRSFVRLPMRWAG